MNPDLPSLVIKYGGGSISTAADMQNTAEYLSGLSGQYRLAAVCSAMGQTTNDLIGLSRAVGAGDRGETGRMLDDIAGLHDRATRGIIERMPAGAPGAARLEASMGAAFDDIRSLIDGLLLLGEETARTRDYIMSFGERFSILLMSAALQGLGMEAVPLSGKDAGILTDSQFGESRPLMDTTKLRASRILGDVMGRGAIPVLGGYAGADQHGRITTFGRGGSDYTATIIGACINADQIWIMGKRDGMMTADPKIVPDSRVLEKISYTEAAEMSMFGAKQIHPRTFEPVLDREIPMRIRSSVNTENPGTLVVPARMAENTVKCVSVIRGCGLIDMRGFGMAASPGTAATIFETLAAPGISVVMISQNPSESSITIVLKNRDLHRAVHALEMEHLGKVIKRLDVTADVAVVAVIGAGLRGTVGTASRVFGAISRNGINVMMITQGSSEMNLAFVVRNQDADKAVRALHAEFGLAGAP